MARQTGVLRVEGSLGELSFYNSVFGPIVRRKGGPSKAQIKRSAAFKNLRQHQTEFGACSQAARYFRESLQEYWFEKKVHARTGAVLKLLYGLVKLDTVNAKAKRTVVQGLLNTDAAAYLNGHVLEGKVGIGAMLPGGLKLQRQGNTVVLDLKWSAAALKLPKLAGFLRVELIRVLPDFVDFEPAQIQQSECFLGKNTAVNTSLSVGLPKGNSLILLSLSCVENAANLLPVAVSKQATFGIVGLYNRV